MHAYMCMHGARTHARIYNRTVDFGLAVRRVRSTLPLHYRHITVNHHYITVTIPLHHSYITVTLPLHYCHVHVRSVRGLYGRCWPYCEKSARYSTVTLPLHHRYIAITVPLRHRYITVTLPLCYRYITVTLPSVKYCTHGDERRRDGGGGQRAIMATLCASEGGHTSVCATGGWPYFGMRKRVPQSMCARGGVLLRDEARRDRGL